MVFNNINSLRNGQFKLILISLLLLLVAFIFGFFIFTGSFEIFGNKSTGRFTDIIPGASTSEDVNNSLGKPDTTEQIEGGAAYKYSTQNGFKDTVIIKGNKVDSVQENIFNDRRGLVSDYIKKYGNTNLILVSEEDPTIKWYIFLNAGVGIATPDDTIIVNMINFSPRSEYAFLNTTAKHNNIVRIEDVRLEDTEDHEVRASE